MKTINVNPSKVVTPVQIGYVTDHNETKLVFETQEETNNYLKLQISDHEYEPIPLTGKEWIVTSTYTDKARKYKAQLMRKIDGEYIANSPIFELVVNNSIYGNETIKEVVPPNFKTAYDNMVDITNQIKEAFENGDFNGNGIVSIEKTNTQENIDTYTITFNDETTSTFTVTNGIDGTTPNIQIGTVTTLESDQQVTVERTGDDDNPVFNFGIPKGEKGDKGDTGLQGPPGIPGEATPEFKQMVEQSTLNAIKAERFATQAKQSETNAKNSADGIKAESQKITENAEQITQIKEDLANKLPKSPTNWEQWTSEEQEEARTRIGISGYELLCDVTLEEAVDNFVRDTYPDGTPYNLSKALVFINVPVQESGYAPGNVWIYFSDLKNFNAGRVYYASSIKVNKPFIIKAEQTTSNGVWSLPIGECGQEYVQSNSMSVYNVKTKISNICAVKIQCSLPVGTIIQIYGVRA